MARRPAWIRAARIATLALGAWLGACGSFAAPGGFEDDHGSDGGAMPPDLLQPECDPRRLGECPAGQKCSYVEDDLGPNNRCVDLIGEGLDGEPCDRVGDTDTCASHHVCWASDLDGQGGVCVSFCSAVLTCFDPLAICSVSNDGLLSLCLRKCDPLIQDCAAGWGCYPDDYQRWACDRDQSGELGAHADPCTCLNCCDPGLLCRNGALVDGEGCGPDGAAGCCAPVCMLDDGAPVDGVCPTEAERCERFYDDTVQMGYEDVGVCEL